MVWDFCEANILEPKAVSWIKAIDITADSLETILTSISKKAQVNNEDATKLKLENQKYLISTDPPYYDNIGYSDLSDIFYVWLRKGLQEIYPNVFKTMLVPKFEELVASDIRYGSKENAKKHFENGFTLTFQNFVESMDKRFPLTVYYAFKQDESAEDEDGDKSINLTTGWETLLEGLTTAGFEINATWPIKASQKWRMVARDTNSLTSYIVLACRPRTDNITTITKRDFLQILKNELPTALGVLQRSNLAPVDLAQAAIGPGMSIYSRYNIILEQDGSKMVIKTALQLINRSLDEFLSEQENDFDPETRWAISWYEENGFEVGEFGNADALARAKNTAVNGLVQSGIVSSGGGKVKLLARDEYSSDWDPAQDKRIVIWEMTQNLLKQMQENGELGAAKLFKQLGVKVDVARELAYRLFSLCEKKGWTQEAQAYNSLVLSWNQIVTESYNIKDIEPTQTKLFE